MLQGVAAGHGGRPDRRILPRRDRDHRPRRPSTQHPGIVVLISTSGEFGDGGVDPVTQHRQRFQRPGPGLGMHQLRVRQLIDQRVDLIQHRRVFGGQVSGQTDTALDSS